DGSRDLEVDTALLLENGFEELGGVDFQKGCYIGQELTARTRYRALIKKRLIPVKIDGDAPTPGTLLSVDGKEAGEMKTSAGGHGLALVRLAQWRASADGTLSSGSTILKPEPVPWMVLPQGP
ncbi:MAG: CAF17-like 4Fe-4S cluster assembly/insertion protein YgfZ, partial [Rhodospirillales bacterium]